MIPSDKCIEIAKRLQQQNNKIEVRVYDNANHAMKEKGISGQHYPENYFEDLSSWIKRN